MIRDAMLRLTCLLATLLLLVGCRDVRRLKGGGAEATSTPAPLAKDASPRDVAQSLLDAAAQARAIRRQGLGSQEALDQYTAVLARVRSLAIRDRLHQLVKQHPTQLTPKDIDEDAAVKLVTESWLAILAHYIDGLPRARFEPVASQTPDRAQVRLVLANPRELETVAKIENEPAMRAMAERAGDHSPEYLEKLRDRTLPLGFNAPVEALVTIKLEQRAGGGWGIVHVDLGPSTRRISEMAMPVTQPALTSQPGQSAS